MENPIRNVRVLYNPKSGLGVNAQDVRKAVERFWDVPGIDLTYQVSQSVEDGVAKAERAVQAGVDTIIVMGGDGMVNSIGSVLLGSKTALAVIPSGSGNGFARHFDIPLNLLKAAKILSQGVRKKIDVGFVDNRPFFITCGLAWDAEIVKGFEESPVRGILPYVFSGIYHWFKFEPQNFDIELDGKPLVVKDPIILTVANLTEFGAGAKIAPNAKADDGKLVLVAVPKLDPITFMTQIHRLFDGTISEIEEVHSFEFEKMVVKRERASEIQIDGELLKMKRDFHIEVKKDALEVIIPPEGYKSDSKWEEFLNKFPGDLSKFDLNIGKDK
jgi:diacylglycerol kinase (ATP)